MKLVNKKGKFNVVIEFLLYAVLYTAAFMAVEKIFESFVIRSDYKVIFAFLSVAVIYALEKIVKPILVTICTPITGVTFGLFYIVINVVILKLADWIMQSKLDFEDFWALFVISIVLALLNLLIEKLIIEPMVRKAGK